MKESTRNTKSSDENNKTTKKITKLHILRKKNLNIKCLQLVLKNTLKTKFIQ